MKPQTHNFVSKPMPERLVLFSVAFVFWLLLVTRSLAAPHWLAWSKRMMQIDRIFRSWSRRHR